MNDIMKQWVRLFFLLCFTNTVGYVAATFVTPDALAWFHTLPQAPYRIADLYLFWGSVVSYTFMAIGAFLVWNKVSPRFFALQLVCNGMWPFVLFYMHAPKGAAVILLLLLSFLMLAMRAFARVSKPAAAFLIPTWILNVYLAYLGCYAVLAQFL